MSVARALLLDDGEVPTAQLQIWLRAARVEVVTLRDFFEVPRLLESQRFDVLIGHEVFLMTLKEMNAPGQRWLLVATPSVWTRAQLDSLGARGTVTENVTQEELHRLLEETGVDQLQKLR